MGSLQPFKFLFAQGRLKQMLAGIVCSLDAAIALNAPFPLFWGRQHRSSLRGRL